MHRDHHELISGQTVHLDSDCVSVPNLNGAKPIFFVPPRHTLSKFTGRPESWLLAGLNHIYQKSFDQKKLLTLATSPLKHLVFRIIQLSAKEKEMQTQNIFIHKLT